MTRKPAPREEKHPGWMTWLDDPWLNMCNVRPAQSLTMQTPAHAVPVDGQTLDASSVEPNPVEGSAPSVAKVVPRSFGASSMSAGKALTATPSMM
eukprot:CAMPEP_0202739158 /NCGR_PEP_ID=MMETSP1388-20130828/2661_1 /ASSEMBLY_ACC=CAM_ASM_000864 /TAXON_ID=37098 /ORGANISM="Isochrysis sp, Strain CCMP1244" /LENGTH=94 /DNA_ID=CAMNT_0049405813 /DNA_START=91 /DNA_END=372 /DNA_ORIENTATION=-